MRGICGWFVHRRAEVPVQALLRSLGQEGAAVFALDPEHVVRALEPGFTTVAGLYGWADR